MLAASHKLWCLLKHKLQWSVDKPDQTLKAPEGAEVIITLVNSWVSNNIASIESHLRDLLKQQEPDIMVASLKVDTFLEVTEFSLKKMTTKSSTVIFEYVCRIKSVNVEAVLTTTVTNISVTGAVCITIASLSAWPHIGKVELTLDQIPVVKFEVDSWIPFIHRIIQAKVDTAIINWANAFKGLTLYDPKTKGPVAGGLIIHRGVKATLSDLHVGAMPSYSPNDNPAEEGIDEISGPVSATSHLVRDLANIFDSATTGK